MVYCEQVSQITLAHHNLSNCSILQGKAVFKVRSLLDVNEYFILPAVCSLSEEAIVYISITANNPNFFWSILKNINCSDMGMSELDKS